VCPSCDEERCVCDDQPYFTHGLRFTLIGSSYEASIGTATAREIVIPVSFGGLPVTTIARLGFAERGNNLTGVTIPDTVTIIGEQAFDSNGLTSVIIPNSVTIIGNAAFNRNRNLTQVIIGNSVTTIGFFAFQNNDLRNVIIPNSVTNIGSSAFRENSNLMSIIIPNSVIELGAAVFRDSNNVTIYAEAKSNPWHMVWNRIYTCPQNLHHHFAPVIWGSILSEDGSYVVSFTNSEGSIANPNDFVINAPFREGYTFGGWATTEGGERVYDAADVANAPIGTTLWAIWVRN